jgi:hypothetical protein
VAVDEILIRTVRSWNVPEYALPERHDGLSVERARDDRQALDRRRCSRETHLVAGRGDRSREIEVALHEAELLILECPDQHGHAVAPDVDVCRVVLAHQAADRLDEPRGGSEGLGPKACIRTLGQDAPSLGAIRGIELV